MGNEREVPGRGFGLRRVAVAAALAALALGRLAAPGAAQAAITMYPMSSGMLQVNNGGGNGTVDIAFSGSAGFSVPSSLTNSVLVVELDVYSQNNTPSSTSQEVFWNGNALTPAIEEIGPGGAYEQCDIFYLDSPTSGTGSLTFATTSRAAMYGAFVLSGVNPGSPLTTGAGGNTAALSAVFSLGNTATAAGSFAAVDEGNRNNPAVAGAFLLGATGSTGSLAASTSQAFSYFDTVQYEGGGGYVANIPAGAVTITSTAASADRGAIAAAIFTPAASVFAWSGSGGSAGNGTWNLTSTNNWNLGSLSVAYSNSFGVTFSDAGLNTNITITGSGVTPPSVLFSNNTTPYTFSGGAISGTAAVTLSGSGTVTFMSSNGYTGGTTINAGTLVIGANNALGTAAVSMGTLGTAATLETNSTYTIAVPINVNATSGPAILGTTSSSGTATFSNTLTLNGSNTVTLSSPAGGAVLVSGNIAGTGIGAVTIAAPSTVIFRGLDSSAAPSNITGGTLTLTSGMLGGNGAITVSGGALALNNGTISGGTTTVGPGGTLGGTGTITVPTVVNGNINPSLSSPLNFSNSGNLTLNGGSTFVLQAGGGTVGVVQNVQTFVTSGTQNLLAVPLDSTTLNGVHNYEFLSWTTSGPSAGLQTNWNINGASTITWAGTGDGLNWNNILNWNGSNVTGGTVRGRYDRLPCRLSRGQRLGRGVQRPPGGLERVHSGPGGRCRHGSRGSLERPEPDARLRYRCHGHAQSQQHGPARRYRRRHDDQLNGLPERRQRKLSNYFDEHCRHGECRVRRQPFGLQQRQRRQRRGVEERRRNVSRPVAER